MTDADRHEYAGRQGRCLWVNSRGLWHAVRSCRWHSDYGLSYAAEFGCGGAGTLFTSDVRVASVFELRAVKKRLCLKCRVGAEHNAAELVRLLERLGMTRR